MTEGMHSQSITANHQRIHFNTVDRFGTERNSLLTWCISNRNSILSGSCNIHIVVPHGIVAIGSASCIFKSRKELIAPSLNRQPKCELTRFSFRNTSQQNVRTITGDCACSHRVINVYLSDLCQGLHPGEENPHSTQKCITMQHRTVQ